MIVLDTHIWIWWVHGDKRLTEIQDQIIKDNETDFIKGDESISNPVPPIYRAFGDKHGITYGKKGCYYPGTPFARSSASDELTDAGPRYCLLYEVGRYLTPIRLDVPEVAVFKKILTRNEWEIFYERDYTKKNKWVEEPVYKEPVDSILDRVLHEKPRVSFVTFVIKKEEQPAFSDIVFQKAVDFVKAEKKVITGSRKGIVTAMLTELND